MQKQKEMIYKLLEVTNLKKYFLIGSGFFQKKVYLRAVDGVSFYLKQGESLGLVGESGCGKSTVARSVLRLIEPTEGKIYFEGRDICKLNAKETRKLRRDLQIIFQDPYSSLDPRKSIRNIVAEPLEVFGIYKNKKEKNERVSYLLEKVGLQAEHALRYPHQFSGGQRQRIGIARALALNPKLIIGDEPVSALDVSIQAQIINLLEDLQKEFNLSYIIISHDLAVVEHICDRIAVMYLGRIVESARDIELYSKPKHPYTQALLSAVPKLDPDYKKLRTAIKGDVPSPINPPSGCHFHNRCQVAEDLCSVSVPKLVELDNEHFVACHRVQKIKR
jgi:oligopeptide/dipeptide ABC transporter ATP-binding protein